MSSKHSDLCVSVTTGTLTLCLGRAEARVAVDVLRDEADVLFPSLAAALSRDGNGHVVVKLRATRLRQSLGAATQAAARALRDRLKLAGVLVRIVE